MKLSPDGDKVIAELHKAWHAGVKEFCNAIDVSEATINQIFQEETDWAFLIKIDALLETASKELIGNKLRFKNADPANEIAKLVQKLNVNGKVSVVAFLKAVGVHKDYRDFISEVRNLRNSYAHNLHSIEMTLAQLLDGQNDKNATLRKLMPFCEDDPLNVINRKIDESPDIIRNTIVAQTLSFLSEAYGIQLHSKPKRKQT